MKAVAAIRLNLSAQVVEISHDLLAGLVQPGDTVVDATAGKGGDTLFLADLVGESGRVFAFDLQQAALDVTGSRLAQLGQAHRVTLVCGSHDRLSELATGPLRAAVFNLGYLPGGDKRVVTQAETTLAAVRTCLGRLLPGGAVILAIYWGHPGGAEEKIALEAFAASLDKKRWMVVQLSFPNRQLAPQVMVIRKLGGGYDEG